MATTRVIATEDDLLQTPEDGQKYELVDGEILVSPGAGFRHGRVAARLVHHLIAFVEEHKLGYVVEGQTGFRIPGRAERPDIRIPDISFVAAHRFAGEPPIGFPDLAPDLAVEVLSPGNRPREILHKVGQLLETGSKLVWVIDPEERTAVLYRSLNNVRTIDESGSLEGEDVLPGFSCPLSDILV